jgi:hypothetical protein
VRLLRRDDVDGGKLCQSAKLLKTSADLRYLKLTRDPPCTVSVNVEHRGNFSLRYGAKSLQMALAEIPTTDQPDSDSVHSYPLCDDQ